MHCLYIFGGGGGAASEWRLQRGKKQFIDRGAGVARALKSGWCLSRPPQPVCRPTVWAWHLCAAAYAR